MSRKSRRKTLSYLEVENFLNDIEDNAPTKNTSISCETQCIDMETEIRINDTFQVAEEITTKREITDAEKIRMFLNVKNAS